MNQRKEKKPKVIDSVMKNPQKLMELSLEEKKLFMDELEQMKKIIKQVKSN